MILLLRELRGARARLLPFLASLAVGVAAVVMVAGLGDSVSRALRLEARPLLGGDVAVRSARALPDRFDDATELFPGVERTDTVDLLTMAALPAGADGPGRSLMVELKAVSPGWPFYGAPTVEPARPLAELLDDEGIVVEPALLERFDIATGATVRLGTAAFVVRGVVTKEPGRLPSGLSAGPRVLVSVAGLERTQLGEGGPRIGHRALFRAADEAQAGELAAWLRSEGTAWTTVETWSDAQPGAQRSLARTSSYLGLVALLSLVVGGVGVAQSTRAWMARRLDAFAVQRCLGMTPGEIRSLALVQTGLFAAVGSVAGAILGVMALTLVPALLAGLLPPEAVRPWQPAAIARGIALGVGVALLFAARPLAQAARVSPLRVLRRDVEPLPDRVGLGALGLGAGVFGLAWLQARDPVIAGVFVAGLAGVAGVGALAAAALARTLGRLARRAPRWWLRHGLASLGRPGSGFVAAVVSLALGVVVVLTTVLVEGRLYAQIADEFPKEAPSVFLLDVQTDQRAAIERMLAEAGAERIRGAPMVVARLLSVDARGVDQLVAEQGENARWALTKEQRLSWTDRLSDDNRIVDGAPFSPTVAAEVSLEQVYAASLGAAVGSRVRFDVQGVPMDFRVTSLREVSWETFDLNFLVVAEPGVLEGAPASVLVTALLDAEREAAMQDALAAAFPNVTLISVRSALQQARTLLEKLAWGIRAVGGFTALAGVAILVSGVAADAARQGRKVALLKTLGTTRAGVAALFVIEYGLLGLCAGALGAVGAVGVSYAIVTRLMRLDWATDAVALGLAVVASTIGCAAVGVTANARALQVRPAEVLRGE